MNYLIIGGVAGGATVAARLRRMDEKANIILFERGKYVSYANCGLPYYIGDTINNREKLFVQTAKGFTDRFRIDIRTEQEVTAIRPDKKEVEIKNLSTGETYTETYDKLVLSPGAEPLRPGIEGIGSKKIFTLRNVPDTDTIKNYVNTENPKRAIVVGGGFIGLEMAENLHDLGIQVDVVEMANQVMAPLDFSMAAIVHRQLTDKGVGLHLEDGVSRFEEKRRWCDRTPPQRQTDRYRHGFVEHRSTPGNQTGKRCGTRHRRTGRHRRKRLYANFRCRYICPRRRSRSTPSRNRTAGPYSAGRAGKQAGTHRGRQYRIRQQKKYPGSIGTSIAKVFDLTVAAAGANAKLLQQNNIPYISSYTHGASHAGYYPGAVPLSIKILFAPENGKLLGAQIVGFNGVDKRIEMLAQVIQRGGTVHDLAELEHAYAPPYSSAKDPVNMAGFVAENILNKKSRIIQWRELAELPADTIRIDVRTHDEYKLGTIPGFINIPVDELREHLDELPKEKPIVVTCAVGLRGYLAYRILVQNGFKHVRNLSGGYKTWSVATAPIKEIVSHKPEIPESTSYGNSDSQINLLKVDACGLMCPGPVMQLKKNYEALKIGEQLQITATDQAFGKDVTSWCKMTGAELVALENKNGVVAATIRKQEKTASCEISRNNADNKTLIVFSDDLDKALASFVIANGAASTGKKVTMFFTFWGLNVIKKQHKPTVTKDIFGKMFGWMLPTHSGKLKLSKMNMGGAGSWMMRLIMKRKRIDSLESLIQQAIDNGVEMIACTMSMDVMGVQKEELMDNVTLGGVASYLERAEEANVNLFI